MTYVPKHLKRWKLPSDYMGAHWPEMYVFLGQHRDSDALTRSNFTQALKALGGESETVTVVRESHWAVGWVEWIGIRDDDETALAIADSIRAKLDDYPCLDEEHWSELEWTEAAGYWQRMSVRERLDAIERARAPVSMFAARHDYLPSDDNGALLEYLRGD